MSRIQVIYEKIKVHKRTQNSPQHLQYLYNFTEQSHIYLPLRLFANLMIESYGCSTCKSNLMVCKSTRSKIMISSRGSFPNVANWRSYNVLITCFHEFCNYEFFSLIFLCFLGSKDPYILIVDSCQNVKLPKCKVDKM